MSGRTSAILVCCVVVVERDAIAVSPAATASKFLTRWLISQPGAICGNDEMALQAYLAALSLGLRIPDDITIVGFDDFRTVSLALKPELTTVALPYYDLGWQGADMLDRLVQGLNDGSERRLLNCLVLARASSR